MIQEPSGTVIVGAGHAGGSCAAVLRQAGYDAPITLVGAEPLPPYQRPPLSKGSLSGATPDDRLWLKPAAFYVEQRIDLRTGTAFESLDRAARRLRLSGGASLGYDQLVLATGARPAPLPIPGIGLDGVLGLRSHADMARLRGLLKPGLRMAIIGAGYIGLEVAATARALGAEVTVFEARDRALSRVAGPEIADFFAAEHRARGVDLRLGAALTEIAGSAGKVAGVTLADGTEVAADLVLVAAGILPETALAEAAGLRCENGIVTDADSRADDPAIFAIGDCARRPILPDAPVTRLESVHNALESARLAAAAILGQPRPALDAPWFWSDQYDLKLQTVGLQVGHDRWILRGDTASRKFSVWYLKDNRIVAVDAVNAAPDFLAAKEIVGKDLSAPADLAQASVPVKHLLGQVG